MPRTWKTSPASCGTDTSPRSSCEPDLHKLNLLCCAIPQWMRINLGKRWKIFWLICNAMINKPDEASLPGQELVEQGLADLAQDRLTDCSLLVLIAAPRLRRLGIAIQMRPLSQPWEHQLYDRLNERLGAGAHSYYNSLIRRVVSYARS